MISEVPADAIPGVNQPTDIAVPKSIIHAIFFMSSNQEIGNDTIPNHVILSIDFFNAHRYSL
jgi:hypothetical protein